MMTSLPPAIHGKIYIEEQRLTDLSPDMMTLAQCLSGSGYQTVAFTGGGYLSAHFGFGRGFDFFSEARGTYDQKSGIAERSKRVFPWLKKNADKKFFLLFHTYQTHIPYFPHDGFTEIDPAETFARGFFDKDLFFYHANPGLLADKDLACIRALYRGEIQYTDLYIGKLLDLLEDLDLMDETLIILTSDHGDEFFERFHFGHGYTLYDEMIRVPLIFHLPGTIPSGQVVSEQVSLLDLYPTIVEICGGDAGSSPVYGKSLVPLFSREAEKSLKKEVRPLYSEVYRHKSLLSVRQDEYKYIYNLESREGKLFDLASDPEEKNNLIRVKHDIAEAMHRQMERYLRNAKKKRTAMGAGKTLKGPDQKLQERLESLGYLD